MLQLVGAEELVRARRAPLLTNKNTSQWSHAPQSYDVHVSIGGEKNEEEGRTRATPDKQEHTSVETRAS